MDLTEALRPQKAYVVKYVRDNGIDKLPLFCAASHFNLIVAYTFVAEDIPEHKDECDKIIKRITDFYEGKN